MPRRCVVPGCKSNYDSTLHLNGDGLVSSFSFPKDDILKKQWINAVHRKDWQPTSCSSVCAKHFRDSDFLVDLKNKCPRLVHGAIPSVFPNLPQYLTKSEIVLRKDPEVRKQQLIVATERKTEQFLQADVIENFETFRVQFKEKVNFKDYVLYETDCKIVFVFLENSCDLDYKISVRISIDTNLTVRVILKENFKFLLAFKKLKHVIFIFVNNY
jgi:THAP domain